MKNLLILILMAFTITMNAQITSNAPATISATGGKYYISFNINAGTWYNTRSATVDYGGITFPFAGSEIVSGTGGGYYFNVDPNTSCQRNLEIILQDITNTYGTYTITITQLSTVPAIATGTITGSTTVCAGTVNTFSIATSAGSYTTWLSSSSLTTVLGNTVAPIVVRWSDGYLNSSSISGGVMNAIFTSSGFIITARENGCSAIVYDTLNVKIYHDTVGITPTVDNVIFGTPITFTASGTDIHQGDYSFWIKNGSIGNFQQLGYTYTYSNFTYGDTIYARLLNNTCNTYVYSNKVAITGGTITNIKSDLENTQFKVYPNPFIDSFTVENATVNSITDLNGNRIIYSNDNNKYFINTKGLLILNTDKGIIKIISE